MPSRQGGSEVERLRAALAAERAERERLADKLASVLDHVYAENVLPATAGGETGPISRIPAGPRKQSHRIPKDKRWLWPVPGVLAAAGIGLRDGLKVKTATTGLAMTSMATVTVLSLAHSHTAEYRTFYVPPGSSVPSVSDPDTHAPVILPAARLSSDPKALVHVTVKTTVRRPFAAAPLPVPLPAPLPAPLPVPAPAVTPPPPQPQVSSWPDSSQPSQSPQPSDWQAQGRHAGQDSGDGNSGYQGRHGDNGSGSNYWQDGQQGDTWQGGQQQGGGGSSQSSPAVMAAPADTPATAPVAAPAPADTSTATPAGTSAPTPAATAAPVTAAPADTPTTPAPPSS